MRTMVIVERTHPKLLAEVTDLLATHRINVNDFSGQVVGDTAVISLQVEPYRDGFRILSDAGYHVYASETLLVRLQAAPGALARLSRRLADAGVDVRGLHIVNQDRDSGIVALETADYKQARTVLADLLLDGAGGQNGH